MHLKNIAQVVNRLIIVTTTLLCHCTRQEINPIETNNLTTTTSKDSYCQVDWRDKRDKALQTGIISPVIELPEGKHGLFKLNTTPQPMSHVPSLSIPICDVPVPGIGKPTAASSGPATPSIPTHENTCLPPAPQHTQG